MWFEPKREPDEIIGGPERPYIRRWHLARKSRIPFLSKLMENVYLHNVVRSDDDRALHDHPWWNISIVLWGGYYEHMPVIPDLYEYGWRTTHRKWRGIGSIVFRKANAAHRLELGAYCPKPTWTLFITGRKSREWGFYCPNGWKHWTVFGKEGCDGASVL